MIEDGSTDVFENDGWGGGRGADLGFAAGVLQFAVERESADSDATRGTDDGSPNRSTHANLLSGVGI
jgi:hypothetical protein